MHKFNVGDRVRMSEKGRNTWQDANSNPHHGEGEIIALFSGGGLDTLVNWDNGHGNSYRPDELELINDIVENE